MIACVIHGAEELKIENHSEPRPQDGEVVVRFGAGGICGSDLHYYHEGGILDFKIREPLVLGHEMAGEVVEIGPSVAKISVGQRVAVNPLRACLRCVYCLSGHSNLCRNRRFCGSAGRFPHVQGMFSEFFIASEEQCVAFPGSIPFRVAACAEPLGVTLHAVARAGAILGRKVLVTGSGPIGVLTAASARLAGAAEIVVTDLFDEALAIASRMGATDVVNVRANESRLAAYMQDGGYFDAALESSGSPLGLETCIGATRAGGRIVQVGIQPAGQSAVSVNKLVAKELELVGTFLSNEEFRWAVDALAHGRIDVGPILTGEFLLADAINAFEMASDRSKAMKVSLVSGSSVQ
jgi:L-idonate 5-dehydrogenase